MGLQPVGKSGGGGCMSSFKDFFSDFRSKFS